MKSTDILILNWLILNLLTTKYDNNSTLIVYKSSISTMAKLKLTVYLGTEIILIFLSKKTKSTPTHLLIKQ